MSEEKHVKTAEFMLKEASANKDGSKLTVNQKAYMALAKEEGLTKDVIMQFKGFNDTIADGLICAAQMKLEERMAEMKKAGDDPKEARQTVAITTPFGPDAATMYAHKQHNNPITGEKIDAYGAVRYTSKKTRCMNKELMAAAEASVKALV